MPVKRRTDKRRLNVDQLLEIWRGILVHGRDIFGDLADLGVAVDENGEPDEREARAAWIRLGDCILAELEPGAGEPWALREFGEPRQTSAKPDPDRFKRPDRLFELWAPLLESGPAIAGPFRRAGIACDEAGDPTEAETRNAWNTFGPRILAELEPDAAQPWAMEFFGDPIAATKRKTR